MKINNHHLLLLFFFFFLFTTILASLAKAEIVFHEFIVQETQIKRLCRTHNVITVNGQLPGPTIQVRDGDTLMVKVLNAATYNITLHWHGIRQLGTPWADGPEFVTQCPIQPGSTYTYQFSTQGHEGTLWWHAHSKWLRVTVYGGLIIYPKLSSSYPFPLPKLDIIILLGEWWEGSNPIDVLREAIFSGGGPNVSDAYTINGQPGDLYRCSSKDTVRFIVEEGDTILLRIINSALNQHLFFSVANHMLTVVATDDAYTKPFSTSTIMLGPAQTTDVLLTADQLPGSYYMAARPYASAQNVPFDNTTATAVLEYISAPCGSRFRGRKRSPVLLPQLPAFNDTTAATEFGNRLRSLNDVNVPIEIDEDLFFTIGFGLVGCEPGPRCQGPNNTRFAASMNNVSFVFPREMSLLEAVYRGDANGIYTTNFPPVPPLKFDYTGNVDRGLWEPEFGTRMYRVKYNSRVQVVLQDTAIFVTENHPMHLHGYSFYVVAQGFGNFDNDRDKEMFNLVDPQMRNTINVPVGGWAVIRFVADNPGVWLMHCHIDAHLTWGLAMAFLVENGDHESQSVPPPPPDLPPC